MFNKILFDYLKAYHDSLSEADVQQMFTLLTSDISSYDLPGRNIRIYDKSLCNSILNNISDPGPIYVKHGQTLTYML